MHRLVALTLILLTATSSVIAMDYYGFGFGIDYVSADYGDLLPFISLTRKSLRVGGGMKKIKRDKSSEESRNWSSRTVHGFSDYRHAIHHNLWLTVGASVWKKSSSRSFGNDSNLCLPSVGMDFYAVPRVLFSPAVCIINYKKNDNGGPGDHTLVSYMNRGLLRLSLQL